MAHDDDHPSQVLPDGPSHAEGLRRRVVVMRHGEAVGSAPSDRERALTPRGRDDALRAGESLRAHGVVVEHSLVSAAVRTDQTWQAVREGLGETAAGLRPDLRMDLYTASPEVALDELRLVPEGVETALLVGHNPTVSILAGLLDDGTGEATMLTRMITGFPPGSLAVLSFEGPWSTLGFGDGRLELFETPAH